MGEIQCTELRALAQAAEAVPPGGKLTVRVAVDRRKRQKGVRAAKHGDLETRRVIAEIRRSLAQRQGGLFVFDQETISPDAVEAVVRWVPRREPSPEPLRVRGASLGSRLTVVARGEVGRTLAAARMGVATVLAAPPSG